MVIEIVAGRIASRHVGNSIYTWTSIIAVVLTGVSIGNLIGGWLSDRYGKEHQVRLVSVVLAASSVLALSIMWTHAAAFATVLGTGLPWPAKVLFGVTLTFAGPSVVLGALSPILASWVLELTDVRGRALGAVYAAGAGGSIVGTLVAGFVLIPMMGTSTIIGAVAMLLALLAFLTRPTRLLLMFLAAAAIGLTVAGLPSGLSPWIDLLVPKTGLTEDTILFKETAYQSIAVRVRDGQYILVMDDLIHGYVSPADPSLLTYDYLRIYRELFSDRFPPGSPTATLHLGAGAFTFPRHIRSERPGDPITVVEIDPGVTEINNDHLGLERSAGIEVLHLDARRAVSDLATTDRRFGAIFLDAFQGFAVPYHLSTREFFSKAAALLTDDGFLAANVIDVLEDGWVLGSLFNTISDTFEHVSIVATNAPSSEPARDTFVIVASRVPFPASSIAELSRHGFYVFTGADLQSLRVRTNGLVLTDEYAPIDNFVARWLR